MKFQLFSLLIITLFFNALQPTAAYWQYSTTTKGCLKGTDDWKTSSNVCVKWCKRRRRTYCCKREHVCNSGYSTKPLKDYVTHAKCHYNEDEYLSGKGATGFAKGRGNGYWGYCVECPPNMYLDEGRCHVNNCNGRGTLIDNVCNCNGGWAGERCEIQHTETEEFKHQRNYVLALASKQAYATRGEDGVYETSYGGKSILAFRGTDGDNDWDHNIEAIADDFASAYSAVNWNGVSKTKVFDICTGHSLGGALAKVHAKKGYCNEVVTFGAPSVKSRPVDKISAEYINYDKGTRCAGGFNKLVDIVPTLLTGGHTNIIRLRTFPDCPGLARLPVGSAHALTKYMAKIKPGSTVNL